MVDPLFQERLLLKLFEVVSQPNIHDSEKVQDEGAIPYDISTEEQIVYLDEPDAPEIRNDQELAALAKHLSPS